MKNSADVQNVTQLEKDIKGLSSRLKAAIQGNHKMKRTLNYEKLLSKQQKDEIVSLKSQLEFKYLNYYYGRFGEVRQENRADINNTYQSIIPKNKVELN